jgi:hypothetical protein
MTNCQCVAIPEDDHPNRRFWRSVFPPRGEVPIKPVRHVGTMPPAKIRDYFYELDKERTTAAQQFLICQYLAEMFSQTVESVAKDFANPTKKIPVRDRDISIAFCSLHSRILLSD